MLKLLDNSRVSDALAFLNSVGAIGARIGGYLASYGTEMQHMDFWEQQSNDGDIVSVLSRIDGNMTVSAGVNADYGELGEFLSIIGYSTLFMRKSDFGLMGISFTKSGEILTFPKKREFVGEEQKSLQEADFREIYSLLTENQSESISALEYLPWLSDFTYKRNRGCARLCCVEADGKPVSFAMTSGEIFEAALISGVVTNGAYRNKGYATAALENIVCELCAEGKRPYIMTATQENKRFYENRGFVFDDEWAIKE